MECPEAVERGRNFRLVAEEELSKLLDFLSEYLPESLKVTIILHAVRFFVKNINNINKMSFLFAILIFL